MVDVRKGRKKMKGKLGQSFDGRLRVGRIQAQSRLRSAEKRNGAGKRERDVNVETGFCLYTHHKSRAYVIFRRAGYVYDKE